MAALNTVTNIKTSVVLDGAWNSLTANADSTKGLIIMIKQLVKASENVSNDDVLAITMDVGVDSGEEGQVLIIDSYTFNFAPIALVSAETINDRASFCKILGKLPKKFYYRFTAIETAKKTYKVGDKIEGKDVTANIKFNLEELDF